jgi:hypothetical protein
VTAKGVKTTDKRTVRVNAAAFGVKKDASSIFLPIQYGPAIVRVTFNEFAGGQTVVCGKPCDFVRIDGYFFVVATTKTLSTREKKWRLCV